MDLVIVTGMSGGGKSQTANYLEDMGYFCIDNLPPQLVGGLVHVFGEQLKTQDPAKIQRIALVMDVRSPDLSSHLLPELRLLSEQGLEVTILFLDADDETLVSRYKQSRRNHPLARETTLLNAIAKEREILAPIRALASEIINTTNLSLVELREALYRMFAGETEKRLSILIQSFGFKYGLPGDSDNVLDVRFIPNPFYVDELREQSGLDPEVKAFISEYEETDQFLDRYESLYEFLLPYYVREGKVRFAIGVGCTGGRHRSVAIAEWLAERLRERGYHVIVDHRDLYKDRLHNQN
jgi:UPF0042 nucleotide-binding protein